MTTMPSVRAAICAILLSGVALPALAQDTAPAPASPAPTAPQTAAPEGQAPDAAPAAPVAEEAPDPEAVVARIGGTDITEGDLSAALADLGSQFAQLAPNQRRIAVLAALIDIRALSLEGQEAGLDEDPLVARRVAFLRDRALHNAYFEREGVDAISDEDLRARYDAEVAAAEPVEEVHARHILVATREEAEAVIDELDGGAEFETIATERSTDTASGARGGDLGFFAAGQMVPAFETAAFALEPGSYTAEPVESQFGWHVIEVLERREAQPPAFEEVATEVRQLVMRERYIEMVQEARASLAVEYVDADVEAQIRALEAAVAGADEEGAADEPAADEPAAEEPEAAADEPAAQ